MKAYKIVLSLILVAGILFTSACDDSESPDKKKQFVNSLSFTWQMERVNVGGKDVTKSFDGLTLSIDAAKTYSVTNPVSPIWPAEGAFEVEAGSDPDLFNILRDDGVLITVTELTGSTLKFRLPYDAPGGRAKGISGDYEFSMIK